MVVFDAEEYGEEEDKYEERGGYDECVVYFFVVVHCGMTPRMRYNNLSVARYRSSVRVGLMVIQELLNVMVVLVMFTGGLKSMTGRVVDAFVQVICGSVGCAVLSLMPRRM